MKPEQSNKLQFTRNILDRVVLGIMCLAVGGFLGFVCVALDRWHPNEISERVLHSIGFEMVLIFGIFSGLGFIWAIFMPAWLERTLETTHKKVLTTIRIIILATLGSLVYYGFLR